jgi:multimeric flavodoxin WrbA
MVAAGVGISGSGSVNGKDVGMRPDMSDSPSLRAVALVCSLKPSPESSSSELLARQLLAQLAEHGVQTEPDGIVRVADHDVKPGVLADMGEGDVWPRLRAQILQADVVVIATPTWMGQQSSICQRVLERLDAELSEQDDRGRPILFDKVALAVVVGNEDGAHHITGVLFQVLNDVGFSLAAQAVTYWNGEAMHTVDYKDLERSPQEVTRTTATAAANAAHLARLLRQSPFPA